MLADKGSTHTGGEVSSQERGSQATRRAIAGVVTVVLHLVLVWFFLLEPAMPPPANNGAAMEITLLPDHTPAPLARPPGITLRLRAPHVPMPDIALAIDIEKPLETSRELTSIHDPDAITLDDAPAEASSPARERGDRGAALERCRVAKVSRPVTGLRRSRGQCARKCSRQVSELRCFTRPSTSHRRR